MSRKLGVKFRKIDAQAIEKNGLDLFALIEQHRAGKLDGSVHGEIGIGDDFEARSCFGDPFLRNTGSDPGKFHLRKSGNLGHSTESEGERVGIGDKTATRRAVVRIIEKNFIDNQRQPVVATENVDRRAFRHRDVRTGRVIGMNKNHGPRLGGSCLVERIEIDLPTVIVEERIRNEFNVGEIGKKLEQGVTRLGYKNFVGGIAEQSEDVRVGFAGAGGQNQAFGIEIENLV